MIHYRLNKRSMLYLQLERSEIETSDGFYTALKHKNARNDLQFDRQYTNLPLNHLSVSQFSGITVLELASVLAGPGVGQFFAELGANVIKVENLRTGGDVTRTWKSSGEMTDDRSAYFCSINWGKQSIAVDLTRHEGQKIVYELVRKADIVIASFKPGDAEKLHVDYKTLARENPGIIYGQVTGYGSDNPRVGYDAIIQAEAGFLYMNGEPGGNSLKMPVALMDVLAGHQLKEALLLAMLEKIKTNKGKLVEVSLIHSGLASLVNQATNWLINRKLPQKQGSAHPNIAPYGDLYKTSDNKEIILAVGSDSQFRSLCSILNISDISNNEKFNTNSLRVVNRNELNPLLGDAIKSRISSELLNVLNASNVPAGLVQNMEEAFTLRESKALLFEKDSIQGVRSIAFQPFPPLSSHFLPPPHFGEHTREILERFLNYSAESTNRLQKEGIIS
jgi:crotonobetainyl-CoA:carnitine CoA-transferase CaiB-like acyl-CoA transferase